MLFISILLSVWFVLWLIYALFVRDIGKAFMAWLCDMYDVFDEEESEPAIESKQEK